jgi:hypothetical protein
MPGVVKVLIGVVVVLVLGAVAFAVVSALGGDGGGGAGTPEEAVENLAVSLESADAVGILENLDPQEVGPVVDVLEASTAKAEELELFAIDDTMAGVELKVDDLELETEELHPDVVKVSITDGVVDAQITQPEFGFVVAGDDEPIFDSGETVQEEVDLEDAYGENDEGDPLDTFVIAVKRDGGWYVSPFYTLAEVIRESEDLGEADFDASRENVEGADSPEAAVEAFANSAADLNTEGVVAGLPPGEFGFARDYLDIIVDAIGEDLDETRDDNEPKLDELDLGDPEDLGDGRSKVPIDSVTLDYVNDDGDDVSVTVEDKCVTVDEDDEPEETCLADGLAEDGEDPALADLLPDEQFVVAVEDDGGWYVSPMATLAEYVTYAVDNLEPRHLGALGLVKPKTLAPDEVVEATVETPYQPEVYSFSPPPGDAFAVTLTAEDGAMEATLRPVVPDEESDVPATYYSSAEEGEQDTMVVTDPGKGDWTLEIRQEVFDAGSATLDPAPEPGDEDEDESAAPQAGGSDIPSLSYTISVVPVESEGSVDLDEEVSGSIEEGEVVLYEYENIADEEVTLSVDGRVVAQVVDSGGYVVASSDGSDGTAYSGDHFLVITGVGDGDYTVAIELVDAGGDDTIDISTLPLIDPAAAPQAGSVSLGAPAEYLLNSAEGFVTITVRATDGTFLPYIEVFDESGDLWDDAPPGADGLAVVSFDSFSGEQWIISITDDEFRDGAFEIDVTVE